MRVEAYAMSAPYTVEFLKLKMACLKWAWKQNTERGWCQLPHNIAWRLNKESKYSFHDVSMQAELAMTALSKVASTVAERPRERTKWIAELDTKLVSCIFSCPTMDDPAKHSQQLKVLAAKFAEIIATKVLELLKLGDIEVRRQGMTRGELPLLGSDTPLMVAVHSHLDNPAFQLLVDIASSSVVTEALEPKAMKMDANDCPCRSMSCWIPKGHMWR